MQAAKVVLERVLGKPEQPVDVQLDVQGNTEAIALDNVRWINWVGEHDPDYITWLEERRLSKQT